MTRLTAKRFIAIVYVAVLCPVASRAQTLPPNDAGVSMSQWHTLVRDVDAAKKFWTIFGGQPIRIDGEEVMKFPGVFVFLQKGEPTGVTVGTVVDHTGFHVPNGGEVVAKLKSAGIKTDAGAGVEREDPRFPSWGDVYSPDGVRVEILDRARLFSERSADIAMKGPVASDHIHLFLPETALRDAQAWYAKTFGAKAFMDPVPNPAKPNVAVLIPGIELKFEAAASTGPTKGRALDYIGFEVKNLEAFCKSLQASGIKLDQPFSRSRHKSFASARLTDPWGTSIELTEGLSRF